MTNSELDHLITMINQIADNVALSDPSVKVGVKVVEHVNRFWAREMKDQIIQYAESDGALLRPGLRESITALA